MEFVKLVNTFHKMCSKVHNTKGCLNCPLNSPMGGYGGDCATWIVDNPEEAEELISDWLLKNPPRTTMSRFMEYYPETGIAADGYPSVSPCSINKALRVRKESNKPIALSLSCRGVSCEDCRREFWEREVE